MSDEFVMTRLTLLRRIAVEKTGEDSMIGIQAKKYGTTAFTITDGENEYHYSLEIYEDNEGHTQINIAPAE